MATKNDVGLAGEMRVAAELLLRRYRASITFGNAKATDIVILGKGNTFVRVEVKTGMNGRNFVTGYYPKYTDTSKAHPDVWVFFLPRQAPKACKDRFFILSHDEVRTIQLAVNKGKETEKGQGCDNIPLKMLDGKSNAYEDRWELFEKLLDVST
jgi:hypothetical protein